MNLNEQLIEDMFQDEQQEEQIQIPREDISLNFTVSSGNSKPHKSHNTKEGREADDRDNFEIVSVANSQLVKFNEWLCESQNKCDLNLGSIQSLITQLETCASTAILQQDINVIKGQLFKKDNDVARDISLPCKQCLEIKIQIENMQILNKTQQETIIANRTIIQKINRQKQQNAIQQLVEQMVSQTQINLLLTQIKQLSNEIIVLRNQKASLEKTNLFNRTKNSQAHLRTQLQKSKGLSAAKNSTNSSQVMLRNHDSIVFIDPIESDVDEWIKFFQIQKNKYRNLCKKEQTDRQRDLGRTFTKQQKQQLHMQGSSIKEVVKNLTKIRQNTNAFLSSQNTSKSSLKERLSNLRQCDTGSLVLLREENDRLISRLSKFSKINQYLQREKQNLEEINASLKDERLKENGLRNIMQERINDLIEQLQIAQQKYFYCEEDNNKLKEALAKKQLQLSYCLEEFNHNNGDSQQSYSQLQDKIKIIEKQYQENNTKHKMTQIQLKCLELKLKKESLERRRLHNQLQDSKGLFRLYCRIRPRLNNQQYQNAFARAVQDRLFIDQQKCYKFDKIFHNQFNSQEKVFQDVKKLVQSAFDGFNISIFAYGQTGSGKTYTMHGSSQNPGIVPRVFKEIFKFIESQQNFITAQIEIKLIEIHNDKFNDLIRQDKSQVRPIQIKEDEEGKVYLLNSASLKVDSLYSLQEIYLQALKTRKAKTSDRNDDLSRSHFITILTLDIHNKKTQDRYRSTINLVDLAGSQRVFSGDSAITKENSWIGKSLSALSNVILFVNSNKSGCGLYRDSKITHLLKESLVANSKVMLFVNIVAGDNNKQETKCSINYAFRTKGMGLQRMLKQSDKEDVTRQKRSISRMNNC